MILVTKGLRSSTRNGELLNFAAGAEIDVGIFDEGFLRELEQKGSIVRVSDPEEAARLREGFIQEERERKLDARYREMDLELIAEPAKTQAITPAPPVSDIPPLSAEVGEYRRGFRAGQRAAKRKGN